MFEFGPFRLDLKREQLWRGPIPVPLRPKSWEVLRLLVERSGQLVHTSEFLDAVWSDVDVTHGTLTQSIAELRRLLGDAAANPHFIQTVHHRGYRFIADVRSSPSPEAPQRPDAAILPPSPAFGTQQVPDGRWLPGRKAELEQLDRLMEQARAGHRQIIFVTGEAGIGKTSLIRTFLEELTNGKTGEPVWIAGGKCVEFVGQEETYLPVLEAFERLARVVGPERFRRALRGRAPTWLAQIPWLSAPDDERPAPSSVLGPGQKRMLREFCAAVEALGAERTLVLWLEDLHWGDSATVDLLAALASRTEPIRLCVLATYRPVEAAMTAHPIASLKRNLLQQQAGREMPLGLLDKTAVRSHLERQFAPGLEPPLVNLMYEQTEGNPLFMVTLSNHLVVENLLGQTDAQSPWTLNVPLETLRDSVPETLTELVELQLGHMDAQTRSMIEAGSVQGVTFSTQAVAAAVDEDVESVERTLGVLAGQDGFLEAIGAEPWPDGTIGEHYRFVHAAFRHILYRRLTAGRRQRLHRRMAGRFEEGIHELSGPLAAKLALHFERGGEPERAVRYLVESAAGVRQRAGDREAVAYFDRALELLAQLPESEERARQEFDLRMHLWKEINGSVSFPMSAQETNLERALELCDPADDSCCRAYVSSSLIRCLIIQCKLDEAAAIVEREAEIASGLDDPIPRAAAHGAAGDIAFARAELDRAEREQALCISALQDVDPSELRRVLGHDPAVMALGHRGWIGWLQGRPDDARQHAAACLERAKAGDNPLESAFALGRALLVEQFRRDADAAGRLAQSLGTLVAEHGFEFPYANYWSTVGWTESRTGDLGSTIARLREGVSVAHEAQAVVYSSHLLATIAELELEMGAASEGLATIDEALAFVKATGECFWEAEIRRLEGALLLLRGDGDAEACFRQAIEVARSQGARSLELRAATSLSRLWQEESRQDEARSLLAPVYGAFAEGLDTRDLRDAKALLDSL